LQHKKGVALRGSPFFMGFLMRTCGHVGRFPKPFLLVECRFPIDNPWAGDYHHIRKRFETVAFSD
jgi:hypothetical protein